MSQAIAPVTLPIEILEDPIKFTKVMWPEITLYDKQAEVLDSLRDNYETTVHAANEVGKDFTASLAVVWWFASRRPARVITSSSGETQLKSILWSEIGERIRTARFDLGWKVQTLNISRTQRDGAPDPLSYVIGHVTKTVENFQGHHLDHDIPRVLAIFDECSGIGDEFHEASQSWAHRILNIGNPMNTTNYFYRNCKKGNIKDPAGPGDLNHIIHISGEHSPNVIAAKKAIKLGQKKGPWPSVIPGVLSYDEYLRRQLKWDKVKQHIRLKGLFWEGESALVFPPNWLDRCEEEYARLHPEGYELNQLRRYDYRQLAMGVDCGAGRDKSVWTIIDDHGGVYRRGIPTPDTYEISSITEQLMTQFRIPASKICFDAGGGGKQIVDYMRRQGKRYRGLRSIAFGSSPTPPPEQKTRKKQDRIEAKEDQWTFKNKRAEMHYMLRDLIDPSINEAPFAIPEEWAETREDLAILPMWFDDNGKMFLPPKDTRAGKKENPEEVTIKKLLGRSPDYGDSLVLAVYAKATGKRGVIGAIR